jgi:hypothetical protein
MEDNEQLRALMSSLRGSNLSDADFADSGVQVCPTVCLPIACLPAPMQGTRGQACCMHLVQRLMPTWYMPLLTLPGAAHAPPT